MTTDDIKNGRSKKKPAKIDGDERIPRSSRLTNSRSEVRHTGTSELTGENEEKLRNVPGELKEPNSILRDMASRDCSPEDVAEAAGKVYDANPERAERARLSRAFIAANDETNRTDRTVWKKFADSRLSTSIFKISSSSKSKPWTKNDLPAIVSLVVFISFLVLSTTAEFGNVMFLTRQAGLGFEESLFSAFCFSSVYCVAPFVLTKFWTHDISESGRLRWSRTVKIAATPLAVLAIFLFAWKMGVALDSGDVFAAAEDQPWQPKLWMSIFSSMLLLIITVMVIPSLLRAPIAHLFPQEIETSEQFEIASEQVVKSNAVFAESAAKRIWHEQILVELEKEREAYILRCLSVFEVAKAEIAANVAVARLKSIKS